MHRELVAMLALAGTVAAGCAHSDAETTGEPAPGTTTSAVPWRLVAPTQINRTGKPHVTFDPCFEISDTVIANAGLDPSTRKRDDFIADNYAFIGCRFHSAAITVSIAAVNLSLPDVVARFPEREQRKVRINGRDALILPDPDIDDHCQAYVETTTGFLNVSLGLFSPARRQGRQQCDGIVELAELLVAQLPDSE